MKWIILLIFLFLGGYTSADIGFMEVEGGSNSLSFNAIRNPFPFNPCSLSVNITHPIEGGIYYNNNIQINYTFSNNTVNCSYRIVGYLWNDIPCNGSIVRTFPEGDQTLEVRVSNNACSVSDTVSYKVVYGFPDYWGYIDYLFLYWLFLMCILLLIWMFVLPIYEKKEKG